MLTWSNGPWLARSRRSLEPSKLLKSKTPKLISMMMYDVVSLSRYEDTYNYDIYIYILCILYVCIYIYIHTFMFCLYSVLISCTNTGGWIVSTRLGIITACPHVLVVNTSHPGASYSSLVAERCAGILVCFILYSCYCKLIDLLATIIDMKLTCLLIQ